jgi:hypothetical protein
MPSKFSFPIVVLKNYLSLLSHLNIRTKSIHILVPRKSFTLYYNFYPQLMHAHSELQYHTSDLSVLYETSHNKFYPTSELIPLFLKKPGSV